MHGYLFNAHVYCIRDHADNLEPILSGRVDPQIGYHHRDLTAKGTLISKISSDEGSIDDGNLSGIPKIFLGDRPALKYPYPERLKVSITRKPHPCTSILSAGLPGDLDWAVPPPQNPGKAKRGRDHAR